MWASVKKINSFPAKISRYANINNSYLLPTKFTVSLIFFFFLRNSSLKSIVCNITSVLTTIPSTEMSSVTKTENSFILLHCRLRLCIIWTPFFCKLLSVQEFLSFCERCFNYDFNWVPLFLIEPIVENPTQVLQYFITRLFLFLLEYGTGSGYKITEVHLFSSVSCASN